MPFSRPTMSEENRGAAYLSCHAYLHNSRINCRASNAAFVDTFIIPSVRISGTSPLTGCFHYIKKSDNDEIQAGTYDIYAKVFLFAIPFYYNH